MRRGNRGRFGVSIVGSLLGIEIQMLWAWNYCGIGYIPSNVGGFMEKWRSGVCILEGLGSSIGYAGRFMILCG